MERDHLEELNKKNRELGTLLDSISDILEDRSFEELVTKIFDSAKS